MFYGFPDTSVCRESPRGQSLRLEMSGIPCRLSSRTSRAGFFRLDSMVVPLAHHPPFPAARAIFLICPPLHLGHSLTLECHPWIHLAIRSYSFSSLVLVAISALKSGLVRWRASFRILRKAGFESKSESG